MAKTVVGVYLGPEYVDVIQIEGSAHNAKVLAFVREKIVDTSKAEQVSAQVSHEECVSVAINEALNKIQGRAGDVYSVLSHNNTVIRNFSMPKLPNTEQNQAVIFEAKKYIPFNLTDIMNDFRIVNHPKDKKTMDIFFFASHKDMINKTVEIFNKAKSRVVGLDIIPFALFRGLSYLKKTSAKETIIVIYVDNDKRSVSVCVIDKGLPFLERDITVSSADKDAYLEKIISELRVSFDYYHSHSVNAEISRIIICGEDVYFKELAAYVYEEVKIETEVVGDLKKLKGSAEVPASSLLAMGIALGGFKKSLFSLNFSPVAVIIRKRKIAKGLILEGISAVLFLAGIFLLCYFWVNNVKGLLESVKADGVSLPADTTGKNSEVLSIIKINKSKELKFLRSLMDERTYLTRKFSALAYDIPEDVWINSIRCQNSFVVSAASVDNQKISYPSKQGVIISIEGGAFTMDNEQEGELINNFFEVLQADNNFMNNLKTINLGSIKREAVSNFSYSVYQLKADSGDELPPSKIKEFVSSTDAEIKKWRRR